MTVAEQGAHTTAQFRQQEKEDSSSHCQVLCPLRHKRQQSKVRRKHDVIVFWGLHHLFVERVKTLRVQRSSMALLAQTRYVTRWLYPPMTV